MCEHAYISGESCGPLFNRELYVKLRTAALAASLAISLDAVAMDS